MNPTRPTPEPCSRSGLGGPAPSGWFAVVRALVLLLFGAGLATVLLT